MQSLNIVLFIIFELIFSAVTFSVMETLARGEVRDLNEQCAALCHPKWSRTLKNAHKQKIFLVFEIRQECFSFEWETQTKNDAPVLEDFIFLGNIVTSKELITTNLLDLKLGDFYMHTPFRDQLLDEISLELLSIICCLR